MNQKRFFLTLITILLTVGATSLLAQSKPNIVVVIADDHGVYHSTVYGSKEQKTPHMQSLANEGITFSRAYVASPACGPSRYALISGLMPYRNGVVGNHENRMYKRGKFKSPVQRLIDAGYDVVFRGKITHGKGNDVTPKGVIRLPGDNNHLDPANVEDYLINRKDKTKPVALFIGPTDTHTIWPIKPEEIKFKPKNTVLPPKTFDTPGARNLMARYNQAVENVDITVGKVRALVKRQLNEANTLVIYTSDHGQNWPFGKWSLYETGVRVPLIAVWPGKIKPKTTTTAMVSWIDLFPTFIDLAGGVAVKGIDGKSFKKALLGKNENHRDKIFTVHKGDKDTNVYPIRAVRTEKWKYMLNLFPEFYNTTHMDVQIFPESHVKAGQKNPHYFAEWDAWQQAAKNNQEAAQFLHQYHARPKEELYLVEEDPYEENNLAYDPKYTNVLASMRKMIEARMQEVNDDKSLSGKPVLLKDNILPAAIKLYYPNGGETLNQGQIVNITWSTFWKGTQTIRLEYNDGKKWNTIDASTSHSGTFAWNVPKISSRKVKLRITSSNGKIFDESDKCFSVSKKSK